MSSVPGRGQDTGRSEPVREMPADVGEAGLREEVRLLRGEVARLRFRSQELRSALRMKHEESLEMLGRLQEREEDAVQRALRELSRSEQRFRLVMESVRDYAIFLLDREGRISSWNEGAASILGRSSEEVLGRPCGIFVPGAAGEAHRHAELLAEAAEEGRSEDEGWRIRGDGSRIWASETLTALRDPGSGELTGFVAIIRDMSERRRNQRELEDAAAELEETVAALEQQRRSAERAQARSAFLAEASRTLAASLDVSSTFRSLVELAVPILADWAAVDVVETEGDDEEPILRRLMVLHRSVERESDAQALAEQDPSGDPLGAGRVFETGGMEVGEEVDSAELTGCARSREEARLLERLGVASTMVLPLTAREQVLGVLTLVRAGQGQPYTPDEVGLAQELALRAATAADNARLYQAARAASEAKSAFLSVVSHELRTPLNAILGYADLLDAGVSGDVNPAQREQVRRIDAGARHLLKLIEEILTFSRLEAGKESLRAEIVDVGPVMREMGEMMEPQARDAGLELRVSPPEGDAEIETDAGKLGQVLLNLLSNAIKFTDEGSVELRGVAEEERVILHVEDTGIGIDEDELGQLFEPYWQGATDREGMAEGTGLGLSVTRDLVRLMGGEIRVESEPGKGSRFSVTLPRRVPRTEAGPGRSPEE